MLVQAVVCQVFCFIQLLLWEMTGTADYIMPTLHKEPAYQAERQITQAGERTWHHCKGPQKTLTRGQSHGEEVGIAVGLLPEGFLGCLPCRTAAGL